MHQGFFENHDIAIFVNECVYHGLLAVEKHSNAVYVIKFSQRIFERTFSTIYAIKCSQ